MYWATVSESTSAKDKITVKYLYTKKSKDVFRETTNAPSGYTQKPLEQLMTGDILMPKTWNTAEIPNEMRMSYITTKNENGQIKLGEEVITQPNEKYEVLKDYKIQLRSKKTVNCPKRSWGVLCKKEGDDLTEYVIRIKETLNMTPKDTEFEESEEYVNCYRPNDEVSSAGGRRKSKNHNKSSRGRRRPQSQRQIKR
jgi:hypothetical protein